MHPHRDRLRRQLSLNANLRLFGRRLSDNWQRIHLCPHWHYLRCRRSSHRHLHKVRRGLLNNSGRGTYVHSHRLTGMWPYCNRRSDLRHFRYRLPILRRQQIYHLQRNYS